MEDGHTLFDYDVGLNDIVQLMIRPNFSNSSDTVAAITNGITDELINGKDKDPMSCNLHSDSDREAMDTVGDKSGSIKQWWGGMSMECCSTPYQNKKCGVSYRS